MVYWIPLVVFAAHMIEEYPRFPEWATRHFGATSKAWYVYSHIVLAALVAAACGWASAFPTAAPGQFLVIAISWSLACNAVFHIATTWLFQEYSPGVVTAVLLLLPAATYLLWRVGYDETLATRQIAAAVALGTAVQAGVIASLWMRMDIDWALRRRRE